MKIFSAVSVFIMAEGIPRSRRLKSIAKHLARCLLSQFHHHHSMNEKINKKSSEKCFEFFFSIQFLITSDAIQ